MLTTKPEGEGTWYHFDATRAKKDSERIGSSYSISAAENNDEYQLDTVSLDMRVLDSEHKQGIARYS
jgi:hypothetical protein